MTGSRYIKVLLPLRLKWDPCYSCGWDLPLVVGDRVRVGFAGKRYVGVVTSDDAAEDASRIGSDRIKPIQGPAEGLARVTREEIEFWRRISEYYLCTVGEVYKAAYPVGKVGEEEVRARELERLRERLSRKEKQIAGARRNNTRERYVRERDEILAALALRQDDDGLAVRPSDKVTATQVQGQEEGQVPELSDAQKEAYSRIREIFKGKKPVLLQGVTGSGKTEIYLRMAKEALDNGRNVLMMVPEIALSRQLEDRIREVFPERLQVFHSAETAARRIEAADFIRRRPYLVLGTRSSVFLPHRNLGLVVVDEEHDSSYKQDNPAPRYNGREAAIMLAGIFGADVLLGSATPSLESLYNCSAGRFGKVELNRRFFYSPDPDVVIIDTIAERRKNGMVGSFSRKLIERMEASLREGRQVAILRERRAYSPLLQCQVCGDIPRCPRCNAPLSLHHGSDGARKLVCHYCGRVKEYSGTCRKCGGTLKPLGAGTQKIEEEAAALFPEARIARLDSDNARDSGYETDVIRKFSDGEIDILVGTRMVAKGFDFRGLSLVAVIQADSLLGQQDFRADEHGLQLLRQFMGRCGRRSEKGVFVIQTSQPDHPVYRILSDKTQDDASVAALLAERKVFGYPPYSRVVNAVIKDSNVRRAGLMGEELAAALGRACPGEGVRIIGPYSPATDKVAGENVRVIRMLLPKNRSLKDTKKAIRETVESFETERKYIGHIALDVDPV